MNEANPKFNRPTLRRAQRFLWLVLALIAGLGLQPQAARAQMTNDAFASAEVITDLSGTANGSNNLATLEACEPNPVDTDDSGPTLIGASVWYRPPAPCQSRC